MTDQDARAILAAYAREHWLPIPEWEGVYEVSPDLGLVRRMNGSVLKGRPSKEGYLKVVLHDCDRKHQAYVHRLVIEAVLGKRLSPGIEVDHIDFVKSDNRLKNLEVVTPLENRRRAIAAGRTGAKYGEENGKSKLNPQAVKAIRYLCSRGTEKRLLARLHGVSGPTISGIYSRRYWTHIDVLAAIKARS